MKGGFTCEYPHKESCNDREVPLAWNFPGFWKKYPGWADIHSHDFSYRFSLPCLQLWMSKIIAIAKGKEPCATTPRSSSRQQTDLTEKKAAQYAMSKMYTNSSQISSGRKQWKWKPWNASSAITSMLGTVSLTEPPVGAVPDQRGTWQEGGWQVTEMVLFPQLFIL